MTPSKTPFAGYERLAPGDPLSSDGFYFQATNPLIADRLGRIGAVTHLHDGHAALPDPTTGPTVAANPSGGAIPAGLSISVVYTLLDADGGETLPVPATNIITASPYLTPTASPAAALDHLTGTLLAGGYQYAVTVTDGAGGETAVGPSASLFIAPGTTNNEVGLSGLTTIVNASSGGSTTAGWRLWRKIGGGVWYLIATGPWSTDAFLDNGVAGDCSVAPPLTGTTKGANTLSVTVPSAGQPPAAVAFNIYATIDGSFASPALLASLPVSQYDVAHTFTALNLQYGSPPPVSSCFPGASPIDALTEIVNLAAAIAGLGIGGGGSSLAESQEGGSYVLQLSDLNSVVEFTSAAAVTCTIPLHASVAFPIGAIIEIFQYAAGQVTIVGATGVTLRSFGGLVKTAGQYATISLRQRAADEWVLSGNLA